MIDVNEYIKRPLDERQSHLNLDESCLERGGMSSYFKGLMAHILDTTIPSGMKIHVCHACGNEKCSNPNHLYFGSPKENAQDSIKHGTMVNAWQAKVDKYGYEKALSMMREHQKRVCGKGTFYINDGTKIKRLKIGEEIPNGWSKGRIKKK